MIPSGSIANSIQRGDVDGEEVGRKAVVSGCDAPEVLEAADHELDGISVALSIGREAGLPDAIYVSRA